MMCNIFYRGFLFFWKVDFSCEEDFFYFILFWFLFCNWVGCVYKYYIVRNGILNFGCWELLFFNISWMFIIKLEFFGVGDMGMLLNLMILYMLFCLEEGIGRFCVREIFFWLENVLYVGFCFGISMEYYSVVGGLILRYFWIMKCIYFFKVYFFIVW